jgi:crossover junction endodeoxyribonuclease RuvC
VDIYIGIDPGAKNCALVAWSPTEGLVTTWMPKGRMPTGVLRLKQLMVEIEHQLRLLDKEGEILLVAMEGYSMYEKFGQHASGEVGAAIKLALLDHFTKADGIDITAYPVLVAPQQLKKFATGSGNSKKEMITKEVLKRWGEDFDDTNLAEAYVLARIAHAVDTQSDQPTKFQGEVVKALEGRTERPPGGFAVRRRLARIGGRGATRTRL